MTVSNRQCQQRRGPKHKRMVSPLKWRTSQDRRYANWSSVTTDVTPLHPGPHSHSRSIEIQDDSMHATQAYLEMEVDIHSFLTSALRWRCVVKFVAGRSNKLKYSCMPKCLNYFVTFMVYKQFIQGVIGGTDQTSGGCSLC